MAAFIEILPRDRPIFMLGQPNIPLFTSGGPGEALGDLQEGQMPMMGCCGSYMSMADLACCGADEEGMGSVGALGPEAPEVKAKRTHERCQKLDEHLHKVLDQIKKVEGDKSLTQEQKDAAVAELRSQTRQLKRVFRACIRYLRHLVRKHGKRIKAAGMSGLAAYAERKSEVEECREKVARLHWRLRACNKRYADHMRQYHG